jgi:hypothetical protein
MGIHWVALSKVNEEITAPKLYNWRDSELKDQIPVLDNEDTG